MSAAAQKGRRWRADSLHVGALPLWARRAELGRTFLLYLRGISTGDFQEALAALLGKDAPNLSPAVISRLTAEWQGGTNAGRNAICAPVRVRVGGRRLPSGPHGRPRRMHAGADRRARKARKLIGFGRAQRRAARAARRESRGLKIAPDAVVMVRSGSGSARRGLPRHAASAVLGAHRPGVRADLGAAPATAEHLRNAGISLLAACTCRSGWVSTDVGDFHGRRAIQTARARPDAGRRAGRHSGWRDGGRTRGRGRRAARAPRR